MPAVAGVDAYHRGWVAIVTDEGRVVRSLLAPTFRHMRERLGNAVLIGIDIPIGLPESGTRPADLAARAFVGPRRSSVFATPTRAAIACPSYREARQVLPSLSAQSYALRKKILEVEADRDERVFEIHPEVSFAALAGGHLHHSKRSWNGQMERRRLLAGAGLVLPDELDAGAEAGADDVLDATVAAWSAGRKARGEAKTLPAEALDETESAVAIWY